MTRRAPLLALLLTAAMAATGVQAKDVDVAGHYYLEGVMETGSELMLKPDGTYQFYLVYGALDVFSEGRWTKNKDVVTLVTDPETKIPKEARAFERLELHVERGDKGEMILDAGTGDRPMHYVQHHD